MLALIVFVVAEVGLYMFLGMFHGLHNVAFHAVGTTVSWFAILFVAFSLLFGKFCFGGK